MYLKSSYQTSSIDYNNRNIPACPLLPSLKCSTESVNAKSMQSCPEKIV